MRPTQLSSTLTRIVASGLVFGLGVLLVLVMTPAASARTYAHYSFDLVPSVGAAACLSLNARGEVKLTSKGPVQQMSVKVEAMPPHTTFTVFILQLPHAPFGLSWYQGDIVTDAGGHGQRKFIGIFSDETFVVAPGVGAAPVVHADGTFPDADTNPVTAPVHMFHVGMWFDSTAEATAAGCVGTQSAFNGDHTAGIQALNTANFADGAGPIGQFMP